MKRTGLFVLFILAFSLNPISSFSQTLASEGITIISGGALGAYSTWKNQATNHKDSRYDINFYGEHSVFYTDQLALGMMLGQGYSVSESKEFSTTTESYEFGPLVRFFPAPETSPIFLFGSFKLSYSKSEYEISFFNQKPSKGRMEDDYKMVALGVGYQIAVTESWAVEPAIEYSRVIGNRGNTENFSQIMFGVSISTYLPAE